MGITFIAKKIGMSSLFEGTLGSMIPVTLLYIDKCRVVGLKTKEIDGYDAIIVGSGVGSSKKKSKSVRVAYEKLGVELPKKIREFRIRPSDIVPKIGSICSLSDGLLNKFVDVSAVSIGKGTAGGMKRHGFAGLEDSHGVSVSHRSIGSTGQCQDPGKVFKNKKMPGHMGYEKVTIQNLRIVNIRLKDSVIIVKGAVPGPKGCYVIVRNAIKHVAVY